MRSFCFVQFEVPWVLGPHDGRYPIRDLEGPADAPPARVLVLQTLGAPERRRLLARRSRNAAPEPVPVLVATTRTTLIDTSAPLDAERGAGDRWLAQADEPAILDGLSWLNRVLHAHRLAAADPYVRPLRREDLLVARVGYGRGEQVADGRWSEAREIGREWERQRRTKLLAPQNRLAALLNGRQAGLVCEELALRARLDLDEGRWREAALELSSALDALLSELPPVAGALALDARLEELESRHEEVAAAAEGALEGPLGPEQRDVVAVVLGRLEASLRARAAVV